MSDMDSLDSVKRRLEGIRSEHSARMELAARKLAESNKATAESHKNFVDKEKRLVERLREMAKAKREAAANRNKPKEYTFGPEDDSPPDEIARELAALERARAANAAPPDDGGSFLRGPEPVQHTPRTPSAPPLPPPPVQPARPPAPPRRRQPTDDDDDFGGQSWLT